MYRLKVIDHGCKIAARITNSEMRGRSFGNVGWPLRKAAFDATKDPEMKFGIWEAIARRQAWYVTVLEQRLGEWSKERVDAGTDLETMRYVLALAKRVDRHEQLMIRHLSKGVTSAPERGKRHR
jgi:hypothetical protein